MTDVIARFEFKADRAAEFCENDRTFSEVRYPEVEDLIADCEEFGDALIDCTAYVNGKVIVLSDMTAK